jgi:signal peptidase I
MKAFREILSWVIPIAVGLLVALAIKQFWFTMVRVDGTSMEPNLTNNERVFVFKTAEIKRGSVVVFDAYGEDPQATTHKDYVKRVIGMPGDTVSAVNGVIKVNGKTIDQDYIPESEQTATNTVNNVGNWSSLKELGEHMNWDQTATVTVPKGKYFVLGDHRSVSNDSRYWGFVSKDKVLGVVKAGFWSDSEKKTNINSQWKNFYEN